MEFGIAARDDERDQISSEAMHVHEQVEVLCSLFLFLFCCKGSKAMHGALKPCISTSEQQSCIRIVMFFIV